MSVKLFATGATLALGLATRAPAAAASAGNGSAADTVRELQQRTGYPRINSNSATALSLCTVWCARALRLQHRRARSPHRPVATPRSTSTSSVARRVTYAVAMSSSGCGCRRRAAPIVRRRDADDSPGNDGAAAWPCRAACPAISRCRDPSPRAGATARAAPLIGDPLHRRGARLLDEAPPRRPRVDIAARLWRSTVCGLSRLPTIQSEVRERKRSEHRTGIGWSMNWR